MKKYHVLLIAGGWSSEREISLKGGHIIEKILIDRGHTVTFYDLAEGFAPLAPLAKKVDVAFINLHGSPGEDGLVQAFLHSFNCPYQGGDAPSSLLALHKETAKVIFADAQIPIAKSFFLPTIPTEERERKALLDTLTAPLKYPLFVKSNNGGSSIHLYRVTKREELETALDSLFGAELEALVEEHILGQEVSCGVLVDRALPPTLIIPKGDFFDFHNKYAVDGATEICPAPISEELTKRVQELALKAHIALGISDYSRSDFIIKENGEIIILETNTLPGMTSTSILPKQAEEIGIAFHELIEILLENAFKKRKYPLS